MDSLDHLNEALSYIEENLRNDIDYQEVARLAYCSEYHFKRMFSFLTGITLSEYIRRRRLTLAAFELKNRSLKVIDVAMKYRYNSPDAFTRAFQNIHGITPSQDRDQGIALKAYPKMTFLLSIQGGIEMNYRIEQKEAFRVVGLKQRIKLVPTGSNPEIVEMWEKLTDERQKQIDNLSDCEPSGIISVCTQFSEDQAEQAELDYYIAAATTKPCPDSLTELNIPAFSWAIFKADGEWEKIQETWGRIYTEWFPTSGYEHAEGPEILADQDDHSEIWIPVVKK